jgi:uncharacterized membrane protein YjjB (DUF3815 family)
VLTAGLALLLQPTAWGLTAAFALGLLVGLLKLPRFATLELIFPIAAAFAVATVVFGVSHIGDLGDNPLRVLIPPLATFIPGGLLATAVVELATGHMVAGSSRLVMGLVQLGLLALGIVAAATLVGVETGALTDDPLNQLGWWARWVGVPLLALGLYLHFSAPLRSLPWILVVLAVAYAAQTLSAAAFGGTLSGFFGAVAMTPVVLWIDRRSGGPPSLVLFQPAFWLLVPGALGLIGLTELAGASRALGSEDVGTALAAVASVALGVLVGTAAFQTATAGIRRAATVLAEPPRLGISARHAAGQARAWRRRRR